MDWLASLEEMGFAIVPGLLDPGEVDRVAAAFDALVERARTLPGDVELDGARFVVEPDPFRLHRVVWCGGVSPVLAALGPDPRFVEIASEVLRSAEVVQLIQQAHFKLPGDEVDFAWHQDASNRRYGSELWTDVDGRGSFVQIAVAVDPMGPDNGCLRVVPGTHRLGFVADPATGVIDPGLFDEALAVDAILDPGDAVIFGPFAIHGSGPNRSGRPRRLFLQGYALPGANRRVYPGCGTGYRRVSSRRSG